LKDSKNMGEIRIMDGNAADAQILKEHAVDVSVFLKYD